MGKNHIILRIPIFASHDLQKHLNFTQQWLDKIYKKKPELFDKYRIDNLPDSYQLTFLDKHKWTVNIKYQNHEKALAKLDNGVLNLTIPKDIDDFEKRKIIREITSKVVAKVFKNYVVDRIKELNALHFNKTITGVSLKYNATNWGSCSTKGRINLSTRALLLPPKSLDYILIHELSHLVEMNHSARFWSVVKKVMPDYEYHEAFIAENSAKLNF